VYREVRGWIRWPASYIYELKGIPRERVKATVRPLMRLLFRRRRGERTAELSQPPM
jgi:hypothetical protein